MQTLTVRSIDTLAAARPGNLCLRSCFTYIARWLEYGTCRELRATLPPLVLDYACITAHKVLSTRPKMNASDGYTPASNSR
jgi:hypothetical protein